MTRSLYWCLLTMCYKDLLNLTQILQKKNLKAYCKS